MTVTYIKQNAYDSILEHESLWDFHAVFWHNLSQYLTFLQLEQIFKLIFFSAPATSPQWSQAGWCKSFRMALFSFSQWLNPLLPISHFVFKRSLASSLSMDVPIILPGKFSTYSSQCEKQTREEFSPSKENWSEVGSKTNNFPSDVFVIITLCCTKGPSSQTPPNPSIGSVMLLASSFPNVCVVWTTWYRFGTTTISPSQAEENGTYKSFSCSIFR